MSPHLKLAVSIADIVADADMADAPLDVGAEARQLARRHPEAAASREEIAEVLCEESSAAGVAYSPSP